MKTKKTKPSALAAYSANATAAAKTTPPPKDDQKIKTTILLSKANWLRLRELAGHQRCTFQTLALRGLSRELEAAGMRPLDGID